MKGRKSLVELTFKINALDQQLKLQQIQSEWERKTLITLNMPLTLVHLNIHPLRKRKLICWFHELFVVNTS